MMDTDTGTDISDRKTGEERLINSPTIYLGLNPEWRQHDMDICPVNDPVTWQNRNKEQDGEERYLEGLQGRGREGRQCWRSRG